MKEARSKKQEVRSKKKEVGNWDRPVRAAYSSPGQRPGKMADAIQVK